MIKSLCAGCITPDECFVCGGCLLRVYDELAGTGVAEYPPDKIYDCQYTDAANFEYDPLPSIPTATPPESESLFGQGGG